MMLPKTPQMALMRQRQRRRPIPASQRRRDAHGTRAQSARRDASEGSCSEAPAAVSSLSPDSGAVVELAVLCVHCAAGQASPRAAGPPLGSLCVSAAAVLDIDISGETGVRCASSQQLRAAGTLARSMNVVRCALKSRYTMKMTREATSEAKRRCDVWHGL